MRRYELVIVGGGMAGLTFLALLKPAIEQGMAVALVDPAVQPSDQLISSPSFDDRATALSAQAIQTLSSLEIPFLEDALTSIVQIEVSDQGHAGTHTLNAPKHQFERYGAVIANRALGSLLWQATQDLPVDWHFNTEAVSIQPKQDGHTLSLSNQESIHADLVVLCEGGRSTLANQVGLSHQKHPFHARARVASVKTERPHQGTAFERFTEKGPIALLPFGSFSTLVWTVPDEFRQELPSEPETALPYLNENFGQRLGLFREISNWVEYPLIETTLRKNVTHGLIALGNTAATLHPVAGQGFNLAIRGLARTANSLIETWRDKQCVPNFQQLNQLAADIQKDQDITVRFSRELICGFGSTNPFVQVARGIGLNSLDRHPEISKSFALASMGFLANTPAIANHR